MKDDVGGRVVSVIGMILDSFWLVLMLCYKCDFLFFDFVGWNVGFVG